MLQLREKQENSLVTPRKEMAEVFETGSLKRLKNSLISDLKIKVRKLSSRHSCRS
jgi:hypothetical protein